MLLEIWVFLVIMAFAFLITGQAMRADIFRILGILILFLMAFPMLTSSLDYKSGSDITASGNNYTVSDTYDQYGNHTIGFFMAAISALALTLVLIERRRQSDED